MKNDQFLQIFTQHSRRLYGFISTLVFNASDADEVFQKTSLILWKKFDEYDPNRSFYAWSCKIAYYEVLEMRRSNSRLQNFSVDVLESLAEEKRTRQPLTQKQDALESCLKQLSGEDKKLVELRYFQEMKPKEIAGDQSRSVHSIYRAFVRIHLSLRECIRRSTARDQV